MPLVCFRYHSTGLSGRVFEIRYESTRPMCLVVIYSQLEGHLCFIEADLCVSVNEQPSSSKEEGVNRKEEGE